MNVPDRFCSPGAFYEYGENGMRPWRDGVHVGGGSLASWGSLHQGVKHVRRGTDGQLSQIGDINTLKFESKGHLDLKNFHYKQIYNTLTVQQRKLGKVAIPTWSGCSRISTIPSPLVQSRSHRSSLYSSTNATRTWKIKIYYCHGTNQWFQPRFVEM